MSSQTASDSATDGVPQPNRVPDDLELGSFSDNQPWSLHQRELPWLRKVPILRRQQARFLPDLTRRPKLPPLTRGAIVAQHLGTTMAGWYMKERRSGDSRRHLSERLRIAAEILGPTYIKLAQIISAGEGVFPAELVEECKKCRDQVPAVDYQDVVAVIEAEFRKPLHEVFRAFDATPLAAASIAQVHAATLRSGEEVVVKVQRPGIDQLVRKDLRVLAWLAPFLVGRIPVSALANPPALVELFAETIVEELDFRLEAANILDVGKVFVELGQEGFVVPRPHPELVTKRVLVMERLSGFNFNDVAGMKAAGVDTQAVIKTGMIGFLEGAFLHGVFHGDLHGGNLFVMPDGRTALMDFGITGRLSEEERMAFLRMMMSAMTNDMKGQVAALRDLGALPKDTDIDAVMADLKLDGPPLDPTTLSPDELVKEMQGVIKSLLGYGARMPKSLMLYIKNLIFIDGAIATLAPELDMFSAVTDVATHFATTHGQTIAGQLGMGEKEMDLDLDGIKANLGGLDPDSVDELTYQDLKERRALIQRRLSGRHLD